MTPINNTNKTNVISVTSRACMPQRRSVTGNRRRKRRVDAVSGVRGGIEAKKCSGRTPSGKAACDDCPEMVVQRRRRDLTTTCLPNLTNCRCAGRHLISLFSPPLSLLYSVISIVVSLTIVSRAVPMTDRYYNAVSGVYFVHIKGSITH